MSILPKRIKQYLYSKKEKRHQLVGPPRLWKMKQDFQIHFLLNQGLKENDVFLDLGCGTLRGGIPIIDYLNEGNYHGIDVRQEAIKEGYAELAEEKLVNKKPDIRVFKEFDELEFNNPFTCIFAFSVLIHLTNDILDDCFEFVKANLHPKGTFYANVNIGSHEDASWQGYPVNFRSKKFYEEMTKKHHLKLESLGSLASLGHISRNKLGDQQTMLKIAHS